MKSSKRKKEKKLFILVILVLIALILLAIYLLSQGNYLNRGEDKGKAGNAVYVTKVIDGDTFKISGRTVRLLCIDAPEKGKKGYEESKEFLTDMILDKEVRMEKDVTDKDEYGRFLRYVYVNISGVEFFVNRQLVQEGYAKVFRYGNDTSKCDEIDGL